MRLDVLSADVRYHMIDVRAEVFMLPVVQHFVGYLLVGPELYHGRLYSRCMYKL